MATEARGNNEAEPSGAAGESLAARASSQRTGEVLERIASHAERRLVLTPQNGQPDLLAGIDLSRQHLLAAHRAAGAALDWDLSQHGAVLHSADLRGANLRGANLEEADLSRSDLAGIDLERANLSEVNLQHAMLEDSNLAYANLRFADCRGSVLEGAVLRHADMWGAHLDGAVLINANLQEALLEESSLRGADLEGADLRGAILRKADLRGANLRGANLQGAVCFDTNFENAVLQNTRLQGAVLDHCNIRHVHASDVWLDRTRFLHAQLGGALGEELAGQYELARRGYLALERNFDGLGDPDAASWAYRRKRRMQKWETLRRGRQAVEARHWGSGIAGYARFITDQLVEWICDYGESVPRVLGSMLVVYLLFIVIYGATGSVLHAGRTAADPTTGPTTRLIDLAVFSLMAMTTSGNPAVGLAPRSEWVHLLTGLQALVGIALTGLLGFVVGNRIRR